MIYINFCVDWEGDHFKNLYDLKYLLSKLDKDIPVTHFICPSYFYHYPKTATEKINSIVRPQDEIGLHIHCNKYLINNIPGVTFKTQHNYYKKNDITIQARDKIISFLPKSYAKKIKQKVISGRGVPLSVYSSDEIVQIIRHSQKLLFDKLQTKITSFRAGGWLASDAIFEALNKLGFSGDSSAVPPEIVSNSYEIDYIGNNHDDFGETYPYFSDFVKKIWGSTIQESGFLKNKKIHSYFSSHYISKKEQPFFIDKILEIPNNLGATDFAEINKTFIPTLEWAIKENSKNNNKPLFLNLTCHQEGDFYYKKGMLDFFCYITEKYPKEVRYITIREATSIFKKHKFL